MSEAYVPPSPTLELEDLTPLTEAIFTKYGYDFGNYAPSSFKRRVLMVLRRHNLPGVPQLIEKLLHNPKFFEQFLLDITVNTTELFRDPSFWQAIRHQVVPVLKQKPEINVWHAACSSGEEVLSLAILLHEEGLLNRANIYATDINNHVLRKAQQQEYPLRNLDLFTQNYNGTHPKAHLSDYYTVQDNQIKFAPWLIEAVRFKHHDLVMDQNFYKFDFILCRNVLIYFNPQLQHHVVQLLHHSLFLKGFLAIGAKESLMWSRLQEKFAEVNHPERIFQKIAL